VLPGTREHGGTRDAGRAGPGGAGARERGRERRDPRAGHPRAAAGDDNFHRPLRLRLDVPRAQIAEMLPAARILSRSHDPAELFASKELFLTGVEASGFMADSLQDQLQVSVTVPYSTVLC